MTKLYLRTTMKTSAAAGAEKQMIHIQNMIFLVWPSELQFNLKRILENTYRSLQSLMNLIEVSKIFQQHPDMSCVAQRELYGTTLKPNTVPNPFNAELYHQVSLMTQPLQSET